MDRPWNIEGAVNNSEFLAPTSYNLRMKEEQQRKQVDEKIARINELRNSIPSIDFHYVALMDFIEKLLHACGGESKANFHEVTRDFMRIYTRVPTTANLHPFLPDGDKDNPRFHKVVSQILIGIPAIKGIRWVPDDGGSNLILSIVRDI